jgi:hypothetical protein
MINWTKEDVEFICKTIVLPAITEATKAISENEEKLQEIQHESYSKIFESIINRLNKISYEQERDRRFYKMMFSELTLKNQLITPTRYDAFYKSWCEEFDKLNKEKLYG